MFGRRFADKYQSRLSAPMALGPIPGIRPISPVNASEKGRDLPSPLAPDRTGPMDDDGYGEHGDGSEHGLAREDTEVREQDQIAPDSGTPVKKIDVVA